MEMVKKYFKTTLVSWVSPGLRGERGMSRWKTFFFFFFSFPPPPPLLFYHCTGNVLILTTKQKTQKTLQMFYLCVEVVGVYIRCLSNYHCACLLRLFASITVFCCCCCCCCCVFISLQLVATSLGLKIAALASGPWDRYLDTLHRVTSLCTRRAQSWDDVDHSFQDTWKQFCRWRRLL